MMRLKLIAKQASKIVSLYSSDTPIVTTENYSLITHDSIY